MVLEFTKDIRIQDDHLLFNAVVSCTILLTEDNYKGFSSCDTSPWLDLSCDAKITDKLEAFVVASIKPYPGIRAMKKDGATVSKNIVPIISKKDLEAEATALIPVMRSCFLILPIHYFFCTCFKNI